MEQLLCHLAGDFLFQTSWMANNKYTKWTPAIVHGCIYTLVFLSLTHDWWRLAIIGGTHIVIDHYRLAGLWARIVNWNWKDPQPFLPLFVLVSLDQTMHLLINYVALSL